jgi:hypothetical protein
MEKKMKKLFFLTSILSMLAITACGLFGTPTPQPILSTPTTPQIVTATPLPVLPTYTSALPTLAPTDTATAAATATAALVGPQPDYTSTAYLDDRSTPATLVFSVANALNRHEYLRAYSYWTSPADFLGTLDQFTAIFNNLTSVQITLGSIYGDGAAGSIYYTVPTVLTQVTNTGNLKYSACLLLRLPQPANYGEPPITPLHIERGGFQAVDLSISDNDALANACNGTDYGGGGVGNPPLSTALESISDLSNNNYIDNRSGALEVVSSLFNAINRKEYVRAYSYWENPAVTLGNYDAYAAGFNDTDTITASFGTITSDAGAGQFHYMIPVGQVVKTTGNTTQTFVGCYTLHIANPGIQGTLPFQPLGITKGQFKVVPNGTDLAPLLATACN